MLMINNKKIDIIKKYIDFDSFEGVVDGNKRKCDVLYITLITNEFKLSIETDYDIEWIKCLKINDKKDISKYIVGLPYDDKNGWMYLTDKCNCTICRINNNQYEINLDGHFEECNDQLDIEYSDILDIK